MGEESDRDEETPPDAESTADGADAVDRSSERPSDEGEDAAESGDSESTAGSDAASDTDADADAGDDTNTDAGNDTDADAGDDIDADTDELTTVVGEPTAEERPSDEGEGETFSLDETREPPTDAELEAAREEAPPLSREEAEAARAERDAARAETESATPTAESDGGATATGVSVDRPSQFHDDDDDVGEGLLGDGPEYDEEMPLADHIEEMMRRLGVVFLIAGVVTLVFYPLGPELINYLWSTHIPAPAENRPRLYGPLEFILTRLKVAGLAGLILGLPVFVYQTYRFMKPGLYPHERRYYIASIPTSLVLGIVGVLFAHFIVLPAIFSYFTSYTTGTAVIAFGLKETFNLILIMMAYMAIVFQIPLFIMLAIMMNLVTRRWLEQKRLLFWGAFLGISFLASPDPTGMAPIIVTATMIVLYEGTLALLRWTGN